MSNFVASQVIWMKEIECKIDNMLENLESFFTDK